MSESDFACGECGDKEHGQSLTGPYKVWKCPSCALKFKELTKRWKHYNKTGEEGCGHDDHATGDTSYVCGNCRSYAEKHYCEILGCHRPVMHIETWRPGADRAWCEQDTPWSGHTEHCDERCPAKHTKPCEHCGGTGRVKS